MQQVRDSEIMALIERIGEHFRANISNRYIRPTLLQLPLEKQSWDSLEKLTEKVEHYQYQGYHLDELYNQVLAAARFVSIVRRDLLPSMRARLGSGSSGQDRILRDMAMLNLESNLRVFADMVYDLYGKLVELDKKNAQKKRPIYLSIPELSDIGRMLVGS